MTLEKSLQQFDENHAVSAAKGSLCVALVLTRRFSESKFTLKREDFVTEEQGQVKGLGKTAVQSILKSHGITRTLAEEGGRTNRGSMLLMEQYLALANSLRLKGVWDAAKAEHWWVAKTKRYFDAKPFKLRVETGRSIRSGLRDLFEQIRKRQKDSGGIMFVGAVYQHLVGAKLELILGKEISRHAHSTADASTGRGGDFAIDKTVIHVTTNPGEALIRKCKDNIDTGLFPIIITDKDGCLIGERLGGDSADKIEFIDIEQFLTSNIHEWGKFDTNLRRSSIDKLISRYNAIVEACETTPGLTIDTGA